jgi:hypothetical protein
MRFPARAAAALVLAACLAGSASLPAQDADTPLDRALQQVEALLSNLRGTPGSEKTVERLEAIASELRREKESRGGGGGGGAPGGGAPAGTGVSDWAMGEAKKSFVRGCELKESEKSLADEIIVEFATDYNLAKAHDDEKSKAVIRDHTEKRVARSFASRDANRMKDNLDGIIKFWEGRFGRGGR